MAKRHFDPQRDCPEAFKDWCETQKTPHWWLGKPTKKSPKRRTEVMKVVEHLDTSKMSYAYWKPIKFNDLKRGDIFRCWDTTDEGNEVPDQTYSGYHVVNVALTDAKEQPAPMLGVVQCLPLRGFYQGVCKWQGRKVSRAKRKSRSSRSRVA